MTPMTDKNIHAPSALCIVFAGQMGRRNVITGSRSERTERRKSTNAPPICWLVYFFKNFLFGISDIVKTGGALMRAVVVYHLPVPSQA